MKPTSKIISTIIAILFYTTSTAQIKNSKTETIKVYGNCGMCKATIEKAGNLKKTAKVVWSEESKMATLTYDSKKTNQDEILKRIALAGYDSDNFLAPDIAYAKLPECCKYERVKKVVSKKETIKENSINTNTAITNTQHNSFKTIFDKYFLVKDALVKTDANTTSIKAIDLLAAINSIKMETLKAEEHSVWMNVLNPLKENSKLINETKDIEKQRMAFITLSNNIYDLLKVSKQLETIYYQHCPMYNDGKGADWLSKESVIKNPYYGSQMMTCGKTMETIK